MNPVTYGWPCGQALNAIWPSRRTSRLSALAPNASGPGVGSATLVSNPMGRRWTAN